MASGSLVYPIMPAIPRFPFKDHKRVHRTVRPVPVPRQSGIECFEHEQGSKKTELVRHHELLSFNTDHPVKTPLNEATCRNAHDDTRQVH